MTNESRKDFLLDQAQEEYRDMKTAFARGKWNRCIRKAQECVELSVKAVLKFINVEFPKEHDIGKYMVEVFERKGFALGKEDGVRLSRISSSLAEKRAPAYYGEVLYGEEDAREACEGAEFVRGLVERVLKSLGA